MREPSKILLVPFGKISLNAHHNSINSLSAAFKPTSFPVLVQAAGEEGVAWIKACGTVKEQAHANSRRHNFDCHINKCKRNRYLALAIVAQLVGAWSTDGKVTGSIPSQGAYEKATNPCFSLTSMSVCQSVSLSLSLPFCLHCFPLSKSNGKTLSGEDEINK